MKALTVRQPWAWAIFAAGKNIENRSWRTGYRGWIAIHAAASRKASVDDLPRGVRRPNPDELIGGAIVGVALLADIVDYSRSRWFSGDMGWVFSEVHRLPRPVPCRGALSLWTVPPGIASAVRKQLPARVAASV